MSDKHRPRVSHSMDTYTYMNYIAYLLYPPLYIAGPIITFNDFMWQVCSHLFHDIAIANLDIVVAQTAGDHLARCARLSRPLRRLLHDAGDDPPLHVRRCH